ncbi:MAG: hypothetical protein JRE64_09440 [Deltaproteobacteria bacterium]|nr:hypothetical protein [Deltaproteobacteria bacterium]
MATTTNSTLGKIRFDMILLLSLLRLIILQELAFYTGFEYLVHAKNMPIDANVGIMPHILNSYINYTAMMPY